MKLFSILLCFILLSNSYGSLKNLNKKIQGHENTIRKRYLKKHKQYFRRMCKPGSEEKFWKLVQKFRGEGFYVPVTVDENLDKATIVKNLPLIEEKIRWIEELVKELEGKNNFKVEINEINAFFRDLNELQLLKERYYDTNSPKQKKSLKN